MNKAQVSRTAKLMFQGLIVKEPADLSYGWALIYVQAEEPIPLQYRNDFYDELASEDLGYRKALEEAIRCFGVRFV